MSSVVEQIKDRIGIVELVSSYIKVEKAGANFKARCPFHNEKTPSFMVSPDRGSFYCFGCGAKGDIFSFVQQFESTSFPEALKVLAEKAGVKITKEERGADEERQRLFTVIEAASLFFERLLADNAAATTYLLDRGLTPQSIRDWRIGYASGEWRALHAYMTENSYNVREPLATGLVKQSEEVFYDTFRSRIVFPIFDPQGRIVAFSGRIFPNDDNAPKYLNSPETALFKKSDTLYGFDRAKASIRTKGYSIVVEGQMDLVMSHQAGFINTVATSGTALTEFHLRRLMRISPNVIFAYDGDAAGVTAARRAAELALKLGMTVKIAALPEGEDPASLLKKDKNVYAKAVKESKHVIDFYTDAIMARTKNERERLAKVRADIFPLLLLLNNATDRSAFVKRIATLIGIKEEALWEDVQRAARSVAKDARPVQPATVTPGASAAASSSEPVSRKYSLERSLLGIVYWQQQVPAPAHPPTQLFERLKQIIGPEHLHELEEELALDKDGLIFEVEQYIQGSKNAERIIENLFSDLELEELRHQLRKATAEHRRAEQAGESEVAEKLLQQCNDISVRLMKLENAVAEKIL